MISFIKKCYTEHFDYKFDFANLIKKNNKVPTLFQKIKQ